LSKAGKLLLSSGFASLVNPDKSLDSPLILNLPHFLMLDLCRTITRRRALGLLTASSAALLSSASTASAFFFRRPASPVVHLDELPSHWLELHDSSLDQYTDFIANLQLQNIGAHQIIVAHAKQRGSVWNSLPPYPMWKNIGKTLKVVDRIAREIDQPVREVISVYRSPAYNARCPGAKSSSWHQSNFAMDVAFDVAAPVITRTVRSFRNRGLFRGGVGGYPAFTHVDTRGVNTDW
jgi:hypothetical protein